MKRDPLVHWNTTAMIVIGIASIAVTCLIAVGVIRDNNPQHSTRQSPEQPITTIGTSRSDTDAMTKEDQDAFDQATVEDRHGGQIMGSNPQEATQYFQRVLPVYERLSLKYPNNYTVISTAYYFFTHYATNDQVSPDEQIRILREARLLEDKIHR